MATPLTGTFYLTDTVELAAASADGTRVQGTIDLGAYISIPSGQCISIDSVDFIYQGGPDFGNAAYQMVAGNAALTVQLTDLNPDTLFIRADDASLIASGALNVDQSNNIVSHMADLYPDNYGPAKLSESFLVVNDTLYLVGGVDGAAIGAAAVSICARIRCSVVKLNTKDWMALAISSVASD